MEEGENKGISESVKPRKNVIRVQLEPAFCDHCAIRFLPARAKQRFCTLTHHKVWWKTELRRRRARAKNMTPESGPVVS